MKTPSQKRKHQSVISSKIKIKQRENSLRQRCGTADASRPPRRGRPPKNATLGVRNQVTSRAIPPAVSTNKKRDHEEKAAQTAKLNLARRIQAETFIMKLFDRSLDLSKYTEHTPLYPICRAWMANQPRNPTIRSYLDERSPSPEERKDNAGEILSKLKSGELKEVHAMPKPKKAEVPKIPLINKSKIMKDGQDLLKLNDQFKDTTKEEMLAQHINKWKQVKTDWIKHTKRYQQRNELNFLIIKELFKP